MILLVHMIFGAAIGSAVKNVPAAIILAVLSHYFLDTLPHIEYNVENVKNRKWRKALPDILRIVLDFLLGVLLITILSKNQPIIYIYAFLAILPDSFSFLIYIVPNAFSRVHDGLHEKIHFLRNRKISFFWRITSQVLVVIFSIILLRI
jgi:hypothetical protein